VKYEECTANGSPVIIHSEGCHEIHIYFGSNTIEYTCTATFRILITFTETGCVASFGAQGPLKGVTFHNIGEEAKTTTEVTVEFKVPGIAMKLEGTKAQCFMDPAKTPITGEYSTGNVLLTSETDPGGVMANAWWA